VPFSGNALRCAAFKLTLRASAARDRILTVERRVPPTFVQQKEWTDHQDERLGDAMMTRLSSNGTSASRSLRRVYRALGSILMGVALGLLGYYLVTDVVAGVEQRSLRESLKELGPVGTSGSASEIAVEEGPAMDFSGWETQDRAYWEALPIGGTFGRLVATRMSLDSVVVKGAKPRTLQRGPGWIATTNLPGPIGNCAISGHRTTYRAPFRRIDRMALGDVIDLYSPYRRYRYKVVKTFTVRPRQVEVIRPTARPTLTLTACHPPYSAAYRFIVQAELVEVSRLTDAPGPRSVP